LERSFIIDPHSSLWESDLVLVVQDVADEFARQRIDREILKCLFTHPEKETILVLNKIDRVSNKKILLDLIAQLTGGRLNNQQFLDTTTRKSKPVGGKDSHLFDYDTLFARTAAKLNIQLPSSDNKPSLIDKNTKNSSSSSSSEHVLSLIDELKQCENFLKENLDRITVSSSSGEQDSQRLGDELSLAEKRRQRTQMPASEEHPAAATTTTTTTTTDMSLVSKIKEISAEEFKRDLMKTTDWHVYYKKLSSIGSLIADKTHWPYFNQVFMVSAQQNDGVEDLKRYLLSRARPGEWLFTRNMLTDQLPKDMAEMCVREKLLEHVSGEVPYQIGLETSFWEIDDHNVLNVIVSLIPGGKKANVKRHMVI
jgi:GTPase Era involved in 16S rRNA processing